MLDRVPVWLLGCLAYAPALLVIGILSGQPPLFTAIGLIAAAPLGFYVARKALCDFNLPLGAPGRISSRPSSGNSRAFECRGAIIPMLEQ